MTRTALRTLLFGLAAALAATVAAPLRAAEPGPVAVIYPREKEPYRTAYQAVVNGLRESLGPRADVQEVDKTETATDIAARLRAREAGSVVLLGVYGLTIAQAIEPGFDRVVGAVSVEPARLPQGVRGISIVPSPRSLFLKLRELAPGVKTISIVHGMDENDWLVEQATLAAAELGYGFTAIRRDSVSEGARAYLELLAKMQSPTDALWLPQGSPFLREEKLLTEIVATTWNRDIVLFSSTGSHVQRGALFALVPDNTDMGRALGRMAAAPPAKGAGMQLLEQLDTAINIRTANHLGLGLDPNDPRFDLVFGKR